MEQLIKQIEQWAEDRNIINGSKPIDQAMKLFSEFGELADNVGKGRDCRDDVGDVFVVLTIMCAQMGHSINNHLGSCGFQYDLKNTVVELGENILELARSSMLIIDEDDHIAPIDMCVALLDSIAVTKQSNLEECVYIAYNDIKDRKGVMFNGVFIKESDPAYADACKELGK